MGISCMGCAAPLAELVDLNFSASKVLSVSQLLAASSCVVNLKKQTSVNINGGVLDIALLTPYGCHTAILLVRVVYCIV